MDNLHFSNFQRAEVLTQALPYIKQYVGKTVVVKYGGNAMIDENLKQQVMEDIALLWLIGVKVVLIHGGGPEISDMMKKLGKQPEFVNGLRVTDKETVDIVQMVLAGKVNKTLVNLLEMKGGKAMGISGIDYKYDVLKKKPHWIKSCHKRGLKVNVWTVDDEDKLRWVIEQGVDYITTDDPVLATKLIKEMCK